MDDEKQMQDLIKRVESLDREMTHLRRISTSDLITSPRTTICTGVILGGIGLVIVGFLFTFVLGILGAALPFMLAQ